MARQLFYSECSTVAHFTPLSLMKVGMYFLFDVFPEEMRDEKSQADSMMRFKGSIT